MRPELPVIHLIERLLKEGNLPGAEAAFAALPDTVYQRENARARFLCLFSRVQRESAARLWDRVTGSDHAAAKAA